MTAHDIEDDTYRGKLDWALWGRFVEHGRRYWRPLTVVMVTGLAVAAIDASLPIVTGRLIDDASTDGFSAAVQGYAIIYTILVTAMAIGIWLFIVMSGKAATGVAYDLRRAGFARLQELSFSYFDRRPVGWLVTRLTSDCDKVSSLMPWFLLDMTWGPALIVAIAGAMLWLDPMLGSLVLLITPALAIVSLAFQRVLLESSRKVRKTNSQLTASYNEAIIGVRTTKVLGREQGNLEEFKQRSTQMYNHSMRNALQSAVYLPLVLSISSVGVGLALWQGGIALGTQELSAGTLIAFIQYATLLSMPVQDMAQRFTQLQGAQAAAERIQSLLDTEPEIGDSAEVRAALQRHATQSLAPGAAPDGGDATIEHIEFRDVSFWYKSGETVLDRCSFSVRAGQTVALVGPTGGGKSTIVSLVARFYDVCRGSIEINGVDHRERSLHWLQSNLGVVLQTPHLFRGSIADNIRYGRLDASQTEVETAARTVHAHRFISQLRDGYNTDVGEGGSRLSTGQRQLVSLARAVLAAPQICIMDEATSSVDTETERALQAGIEGALADRIAFVIAHRLSTIISADLILVVDSGRIVESGTHKSLMAARGRYRRLCEEHYG